MEGQKKALPFNPFNTPELHLSWDTFPTVSVYSLLEDTTLSPHHFEVIFTCVFHSSKAFISQEMKFKIKRTRFLSSDLKVLWLLTLINSPGITWMRFTYLTSKEKDTSFKLLKLCFLHELKNKQMKTKNLNC